MKSIFGNILKELGDELSLELAPDKINACTLKVEDKILVQMKMDKTESKLFICTFVAEIPPGKFRENVFTYTLIANSQAPRIGAFGFNKKDINLVLFEYLDLNNLNGKYLKEKLSQFIEKAISWKDAIDSGLSTPSYFSKYLEQKKMSPNLKL